MGGRGSGRGGTLSVNLNKDRLSNNWILPKTLTNDLEEEVLMSSVNNKDSKAVSSEPYIPPELPKSMTTQKTTPTAESNDQTGK